jgi:hypothetical protein
MSVGFVGLKARDLEAAALSQERCSELLRQLAKSPSPGLSPSLLMLFAKLASPSCRWLDGEAIAVELFADDNVTRVRVLAELGGGQRERVLPSVSIPLSGQPLVLEDLIDIATRAPALLGPLQLKQVSSRCVLLVAADEAPLSCEFPISDSCMASIDVDVDDSSWDRFETN